MSPQFAVDLKFALSHHFLTVKRRYFAGDRSTPDGFLFPGIDSPYPSARSDLSDLKLYALVMDGYLHAKQFTLG